MLKEASLSKILVFQPSKEAIEVVVFFGLLLHELVVSI